MWSNFEWLTVVIPVFVITEELRFPADFLRCFRFYMCYVMFKFNVRLFIYKKHHISILVEHTFRGAMIVDVQKGLCQIMPLFFSVGNFFFSSLPYLFIRIVTNTHPFLYRDPNFSDFSPSYWVDDTVKFVASPYFRQIHFSLILPLQRPQVCT